MAQDADHLVAVADLGIAVVAAVAIVRAKAQVAGDLQRLAQRLIDGRPERISARALVAHAGNAHELNQRRFQWRLLGFQMA